MDGMEDPTTSSDGTVCWWPIKIAKQRAKHLSGGGYGVPSHCSIKKISMSKSSYRASYDQKWWHGASITHMYTHFLFFSSLLFSSYHFFSPSFFKYFFGGTDGGPWAPRIRPCHLSPTMVRADVRKFEEIVPLDGRKWHSYCKIHHLNNGTRVRVMYYVLRYAVEKLGTNLPLQLCGGTCPPSPRSAPMIRGLTHRQYFKDDIVDDSKTKLHIEAYFIIDDGSYSGV